MEEKSKSQEEISASVTRYYDSLTDEEMAEDRAWGEFAASQLKDECPQQSVPPELSPANLRATPILDHQNPAICSLAKHLKSEQREERQLLQAAHRSLVEAVKPVYSLDELQPASRTLSLGRGSCSQRMACLEAVSRACGIATRSRVLVVSGRFWYPRFPLFRAFIPRRILLVWPQFFIDGSWTDFDERYGSAAELAEKAVRAFSNDGESIFDAVDHTPVDFMAKTCRSGCTPSKFDLSRFVLSDDGFLDTRDEAFARFGSFHTSLRGRMFQVIYGGRASFSRSRP
jgi:hypothetical protein